LNKFKSKSQSKSKLINQLPDTSLTLDSSGPLNTRASNEVDGGERKKPISCLFSKHANY